MDLICTAQGFICSAAHHFGATTFGLFWIISFEFVKVCWIASLAAKASLVSKADASLRGRPKKGKGRGREKSAKEGKRESPSFFPSSLYPIPFDACYAGSMILNAISTILACLFTVAIPEIEFRGKSWVGK